MNDNDYLAHYGVLGMKWGVRRYQNPDGTRTALGKERERVGGGRDPQIRKRNLKTAGKIATGVATAVATGYGMHQAGKHVDKDKLFDRTLVKGGKDKPSMSPAEKLGKEAGEIITNTGKVVKTVEKAKNLKKERESKTLSDQELRKRIERLNLEKQYDQLTADDYARGHLTASEILDTVGDVVKIGAEIATMIAIAKMVKK